MTTFNVSVDTDNAAFGDCAGELARILRRLAERLEAIGSLEPDTAHGRMFDLNGNVVGRWALTTGQSA